MYLVNGKKVYDNTDNGHAKTYLYNTFNKLISVTETNKANTTNSDQVTKYTWNDLGNLLSITDAENLAPPRHKGAEKTTP